MSLYYKQVRNIVSAAWITLYRYETQQMVFRVNFHWLIDAVWNNNIVQPKKTPDSKPERRAEVKFKRWRESEWEKVRYIRSGR